MKDGENLRDIVRELMDRCRLNAGQRRQYEERIAKAVWRDRTEVLDLMESQRIPGGVDLRVARFIRSQASGKTVAL